VLGNDGLRLVQAMPKVTNAGNVLPDDHTEYFQAHRMAYGLEFRGVGFQQLVAAYGFYFIIHGLQY
jgi:hypothetical protein